MSRRKRGLSEEDAALWDAVRQTVTPLKPERRPLAAATRPLTPPPAPEPAAVPATQRPLVKPAPPHRVPAPPVPFDQALSRKLRRGAVEPVARLDLHGLRQEEAHRALLGFLKRAQAEGARVVLVITGKGGRGADDERGVLRRAVPHWLGSAEFRALVVSVSVAHGGHGGDGALYVHVRKPGRRA